MTADDPISDQPDGLGRADPDRALVNKTIAQQEKQRERWANGRRGEGYPL